MTPVAPAVLKIRVFVDTNMLLRLYNFPENNIDSVLAQFIERLEKGEFIAYKNQQLEDEFFRNRDNVICRGDLVIRENKRKSRDAKFDAWCSKS